MILVRCCVTLFLYSSQLARFCLQFLRSSSSGPTTTSSINTVYSIVAEHCVHCSGRLASQFSKSGIGISGLVRPSSQFDLSNAFSAVLQRLPACLRFGSIALFIGFVNHPVYDDPFNVFDVHNYATKGLSVDALLTHRNPPGPTSFLWMAAGVRLLGGQELRDARIAVLVSWILLAAGILIGARYSRFPQLWLAALLATLVFPHSVEATATLLTEGPSLLFATLGALT